MSGFWAARGKGPIFGEYVQEAAREEHFKNLRADGSWEMDRRFSRSMEDYDLFLELNGRKLKPGEGPVFIPVGKPRQRAG